MLNDVHDMVKRNKNLQKRFLTNNGWDILAKHGICNLLAKYPSGKTPIGSVISSN